MENGANFKMYQNISKYIRLIQVTCINIWDSAPHDLHSSNEMRNENAHHPRANLMNGRDVAVCMGGTRHTFLVQSVTVK